MEQLLKSKANEVQLKKAENELALQEFGHELRRIRRARKLTQKQLTEITGIDDTVISDLETGNYTPSLIIIKQLAEGLNVSPYELLAPYYGIPLSDFNERGQQALEKIKDIISTFYHFEFSDEPTSQPLLPLIQNKKPRHKPDAQTFIGMEEGLREADRREEEAKKKTARKEITNNSE